MGVTLPNAVIVWILESMVCVCAAGMAPRRRLTGGDAELGGTRAIGVCLKVVGSAASEIWMSLVGIV